MKQNSDTSFFNSQLVWRPSIYDRDGTVLGVPEFFVPFSQSETERTIVAFLASIEQQGADTVRTLSSELTKLRTFANHLSNVLRESRSTSEAVDNGAKFNQVMMLIRLLESHYQRLLPPIDTDYRRTGTEGD
jgi:hypothetical protein